MMPQTLVAQGIVKKLSFFSKSLLTMKAARDYKPLTNEGGGAAGDRRTRSEVSLEMRGGFVVLECDASGSCWMVLTGFLLRRFFDN